MHRAAHRRRDIGQTGAQCVERSDAALQEGGKEAARCGCPRRKRDRPSGNERRLHEPASLLSHGAS